jgi:hypothetical protein
MACVAACSWGKLVLETSGVVECFDFSGQPFSTISNVARPLRMRNQSCKRPADQQVTSAGLMGGGMKEGYLG